MRSNPTPTLQLEYRRRLAIKTQTYKKEKINSWRSYVSSLTARTPNAKVWEKIRRIKGKYSPKPLPALVSNGNIVTEQREVADIFVNHYSSISTGDIDRAPPPRRVGVPGVDEQHYNRPFTMRELLGSLRCAKADSSPGEDQIFNAMLKHLPVITKEYLLEFLNLIWTQGSFPEAWKKATILPILKPGKPPNDPKSYRPISLTCSICKLFERMINSRLVWYLEKNRKFSMHQYGFRKGRSTMDPVASLTTDILNGFSRRHITTAVFFDLEKAFDTIDRGLIISNLEAMGVGGRMLRFIDNYLHDRTIYVRVGNSLSRPMPTTMGVPQGGILSVTCFVVAINPIISDLPQGVRGSLYADDLVLYHTSPRPSASSRQLQLAIRNITTWATNYGLCFSPDKSVVVNFKRRKKRGVILDFPPLTLYGSEIPVRDSVKFLGLTLDKGLNWKLHIETLRADALRALNILRVIAGINHGPDRKTLLRLYWAVCKSKLDYGAQIYSSACPTYLKSLDPIHNEALRIATGAFRTSPVASLRVEADCPSLDLSREELCLRYLFRLRGSQDYVDNLNVLDDHLDEAFLLKPTLRAPIGTRARLILPQLDLIASPTPLTLSESPPWLLGEVNVCYGGVDGSDRATSEIRLHNFLSHMHLHQSSNHIYTDGSKSADAVGFGVVLGGNLSDHICGSLPPEASIFTAELQAICRALTIIGTLDSRRWTIFSDSQSSLQAIVQTYPSHPLVQSIQSSLITLEMEGKEISFCKVPSHVGVPGNEAADRAANEALLLPDFHTPCIPHRDFHRAIRKFVRGKWQLEWDRSDSHLHRIKPLLKPWPSLGGRQVESKICRLRIGHTRLTHGYYMERSRPPECVHCNVSPLKMEHILLDCPIYQTQRRANNLPSNYADLLGEFCPASRLMTFLSEADFINTI